MPTPTYHLEQRPGELHLLADMHHFLSIIHEGGIFDLRPHPGLDPNGWGTSLYLQPFFPGALLQKSRLRSYEAEQTGIRIVVDGVVCMGTDASEGTWHVDLTIRYNPEARAITSEGRYTIRLARPLSEIAGGDLNLAKIASNYLRNVPRYDGTVGDTGDFQEAQFQFDDQFVAWSPENTTTTTFFRPDLVAQRELSCYLRGNFYDNDSRAQGFDPSPIARAYKPSSVFSLFPVTPYPLTMFGLYADGIDAHESKKYGRDIHFSEGYWYDNVGITPLVLARDCARTEFDFTIKFASTSIEPRGYPL